MSDQLLGLIVILAGIIPSIMAVIQLSKAKIPKFPPGLMAYSAVLILLGMGLRGAPLVVALGEMIGNIVGGQ